MTIRKLLLCAAVLASAGVLAMSITRAVAAERHVYDAKAYQDALDAGKPILVHVTAPWCPQCKVQKPIVAAFAERPEFKDLTIFDVDFDTQKDALRQLHVQKQSTLVVYKGKVEVDRAAGITQRDAIEALMRKAL
jgi:thiol-disulfide isomerase/thioredoxin